MSPDAMAAGAFDWPWWPITAAAIAALVWIGLFPTRGWLIRRGVLDIPNERSLHSELTPRGGGIVIVGVTLAAFLLVATWASPLRRLIASLGIAAGAAAALGWMDDRAPLSAPVRLLVQIAIAAGFTAAVGPLSAMWLPFHGSLGLSWAGPLLTIVWLVGLTNAYNFMDGIDGLAAGQALVAGACWFVGGSVTGADVAAAAGLVLASASAGFLLHNWHPARVFLGDAGSCFLGFGFAALPVLASRGDTSGAWWTAGIFFVGPFVFDTSLTLVRRSAAGENVFRAHRSHLYQRLVQAGQPVPRVVSVYLGLAIVTGLAGLACLRAPARISSAALVAAVAVLFLLFAVVSRLERRRRRERLTPVETV